MFLCNECGVSKDTKRSLQKHMAVHDTRCFNCDTCEKTFVGLMALTSHKEIHKKVDCPNCSKNISKLNLKRHLASCSGKEELKFNCPKCPYITKK